MSLDILLPILLGYTALGGPCRTGLVARQPAANPHRTDSAVGATCGRPRRAGSFDCRFPANPCFVRSGRRAGCVSARLRDYASGKRRAQATRPTADDYQLCLRGNTAMDSPDSARRDVGIAPYKVRHGFAREWRASGMNLRGPPKESYSSGGVVFFYFPVQTISLRCCSSSACS